ncbi:Aste57867_24179 [Aphanomyces stellatus]|uniref:Aste57867_24179 protein n=1 Tax=Aphanomyces stellatus TaxID=120398 RepID=A0A485LQH3_9STRA|nr:hypothetical protein As57867_024105 [Aphanomyces stellatus]VFU00821.1 Aste57867_24179 [Aphanomyces stellatus]
MPESDPLTQYLNVVYDVNEATTIILDTRPLPTRPLSASVHRRPTLPTRPQTARSARPSSSLGAGTSTTPPTTTPRGRPKQRPQTARADLGRPSAVAVLDLTKPQVAEQKHIRRRLDAFLVGDKRRAHRVFVGVSPDRSSNQCVDAAASAAARLEYAEVPLVFHTRHLRDHTEEFMYNFNPAERMVDFPPPIPPDLSSAAPHEGNQETDGAVAKLHRRLDRQLERQMTSRKARVKDTAAVPWYMLRQGLRKQMTTAHLHADASKASLDAPSSHGIESTPKVRRLPPTATMRHQTKSIPRHDMTASPSTGGGLLRQPSAAAMHTLSVSPSSSGLKRQPSSATLSGMTLSPSSSGLKRQPSSVVRDTSAANAAKARRRKSLVRRNSKSGTQYVEEYAKTVAQQRAKLHEAPPPRKTSAGEGAEAKFSHALDCLELWSKHVLSTGLPSAFCDADPAAPPRCRPRPKSAGIYRARNSKEFGSDEFIGPFMAQALQEWCNHLLAWLPPSPEHEYDLMQLYESIRDRPSLLLNELVHLGALVFVSSWVYTTLRIAPAWIYAISGEYDHAFFLFLAVGQYFIYRTRIDDMLAPFVLFFQSSLVATAVHTLLYGVFGCGVLYMYFSDLDPEDAILFWLLGPRVTESILLHLPLLVHHATVVLRLAGLLLLLQVVLSMLLVLATMASRLYRARKSNLDDQN